MKTRTYLFLMAAVILIPIIGFSWTGLNMLLEREREAQLLSVQETARAAAVSIDREIAAAKSSIKVLAYSQLLKSGDYKGLHDLMVQSNRTADSWTLLSDASGRPLVNTFLAYGATLPEGGGKWVDRVFRSQDASVSNYFFGTLAQQPAVSVDMPIETAPGRKYVVSQIFYASHFEQTFRSLNLKPNWPAGIFDSDGVAIAVNRVSAQKIGQPVLPELYQATRENPTGIIRFKSSNGTLVYAAYTHAQLADWTVAIGVPVAEIERSAWQATLLYALALGITFVLAILAAIFLGRKLSGSLIDAADSARALRSGSLLALKQSHVYEIDVLQETLHQTGKELMDAQQTRDRLEAEREYLLQSEQSARKLAESQNQAKDEFLAMLGHELRNPLAAISGALTIMDMPGASAGQAARAKEIAKRQTENLSHIVDDLLDISRILAGKIHLERQPLDLAALVSESAKAHQALDHGRHQWNIDTENVWVDADATRMEQIISNLLTNAVKYTQEGGRINIEVRRIRDAAIVVVSDTGVGITPELLPRIFDVFVQGAVNIDRSQGGLGIGLSLVRRLVEMHGGTVEADSPGHGQGSSFTLRFPCITPVAEADTPASKNAVDKRVNILMAEDNEDGREMLATMLNLHGHHVTSARNASNALALAGVQPFDVAILDIGLPDMSGYELAIRLQENDKTRHIKLIALTGYGLEEDRKASEEAGFSAHLTKPYTYEKLAGLF